MGRSHINTPIVRKYFHTQVILTFLWEFILGKSHINASTVREYCHIKEISMIIWGLILGRSHTNAPTVRKHHQCKVLKFIWGHILGRSHTNAPIVGKLFQLKGIFKGTWGLIVKTSHINASSVRICFFLIRGYLHVLLCTHTGVQPTIPMHIAGESDYVQVSWLKIQIRLCHQSYFMIGRFMEN